MCEDVLMSYWCSEMKFRTGGSWKERAQSYLNEGDPGIPLLFYGDARTASELHDTLILATVLSSSCIPYSPSSLLPSY